MVVMEKLIHEVEIAEEINLTDHHDEEIRNVLEMLISKTEISEVEEQWAMCLEMLVEEEVGEIILDMVPHEIHKAHEES